MVDTSCGHDEEAATDKLTESFNWIASDWQGRSYGF